jgi:undecaprenyl-diphosphatase
MSEAAPVTPPNRHPGKRRPRNGSERFLAHADRALLGGAALLALVALMAVLIPADPLRVDRFWLEAMQDIQSEALKQVALVFNALGRGWGRALSLAAIGLVLLVRRRWLALLIFAVVESIAPLFSSLLKAHVGRVRPPDGLVHPAGASFPSGHAAYAGATAVALVLLFTSPGSRRLIWWIVAALGITGMAWSRTYLQVHWLSDVIAGSLLGIGVCLLVFGGAQHWMIEGRTDHPQQHSVP